MFLVRTCSRRLGLRMGSDVKSIIIITSFDEIIMTVSGDMIMIDIILINVKLITETLK